MSKLTSERLRRAMNPEPHDVDMEAVKAKQRAHELWKHGRRVGSTPPTRARPQHCEVCGLDPVKGVNGRYDELALDHHHASGVFRGWLCNRCNTGLGLIGDDVFAVLKILWYLFKFRLRLHLKIPV